MKKLFTSLMLMLGAISMSAQDTSSWEKGQDVSDQLEWQLYDGKEDNPEIWIRTLQKEGVNAGHFYDESKSSVGNWEMYNAPKGMGTYQIFQLPAGIFQFKVQGFHRNPQNQETGAVNAEFFLDVVEGYDPEMPEEYTIVRSFAEPLMRICQPYDTAPLLNNDGDWQNDYSRDFADGTWYVPNSMWGAALHFEKGEYDENSITVAVTGGTYVRLGVRMTGAVGNDWVIWSNFRAIYMGNDADQALLTIAQEKLATSKAKVEALQEKLLAEYGALAGLLSDGMIDIVNETDDTTADGCEEAAAKYDALLAEYEGYYADAVALTKLVAQCAKFDDDAAFTEVVNAAKAIAEDQEGNVVTEPADYKAAYEKLYNARIEYTNSHPDERGAYNYSSMINMPFFCDNDYTPTWDAEANAYIFADVEYNGEMFSIEDTWCTEQEKGYGDKKNENPTWLPICENYSISSEPVDGVWCIKSTTWHGGGPAGVTMQHGYPAVGGWTAEPSGNPELLYQTITNLPNGYYSMSALMCNAGADISPLQYAYIETTDGQKEICPLTQKGNPWWGGNRDQWRQTVWQKLETSMVYVSDGRVTIGTASDAFYASTGFQLYYYGETPNFMALLNEDIEKAKAGAENLTLEGDKANVAAMIAEIPTAISSQEEYVAARELISNIKTYTAEAAAYNDWSGEEKFADIQTDLDDASAEYSILDKAWDFALGYPSEADATYKGCQAIDAAANAYAKYIAARQKMNELADSNPELKAELAKQAEELSNKFAYAEEIDKYLATLSAPYNAALIASLGGANASDKNPVDLTSLIINPEFTQGNTGWEGNMTVDGRWQNAECYNTLFNISQRIYGLPKGTYRVQVQAFYRDGGSAQQAYDNYWLNTTWDPEWCTEEEMTDHVKLFANGNKVSVASLASQEFTETAMPGRYDYGQVDQVATDNWLDEHFGMDDYDEQHKEYVWINAFDENGVYNTAHPFDNTVEGLEGLCYYANSMEGAAHRFAASPDAYINEVEVYLSSTGDLTIGLSKEKQIGNDWCIFDNFKLFYLGAEPTVGINNATANTAAKGIYTISGLRKNALSKGINIVKGADGSVKKVLVK